MNACIFFFQVLKLSGDKILSSRLIIDAMGNFSPVVKQVRNIFSFIVVFLQIVMIFITLSLGCFLLSSCYHVIQALVVICLFSFVYLCKGDCLRVTQQKGLLLCVLSCICRTHWLIYVRATSFNMQVMQYLLNK